MKPQLAGRRGGCTFAPTSRGRAAVARWAHNPKVTGSIPVLATKSRHPNFLWYRKKIATATRMWLFFWTSLPGGFLPAVLPEWHCENRFIAKKKTPAHAQKTKQTRERNYGSCWTSAVFSVCLVAGCSGICSAPQACFPISIPG